MVLLKMVDEYKLRAVKKKLTQNWHNDRNKQRPCKDHKIYFSWGIDYINYKELKLVLTH